MVLWEIDTKMRSGMQEINGGASVKDKGRGSWGRWWESFDYNADLTIWKRRWAMKEDWVGRASDWSAVLKKSQPGSLRVLSKCWPSDQRINKMLYIQNTEYYSIFFFFKFIFGCIWSSLLLSLVAVSRGYSSLWCTAFSLWLLLLLWSMGSRCTSFSSCSTWAQ